MKNHTPTPYHLESDNITARIVAETGYVVATIKLGTSVDHEFTEANAEFIVRACNGWNGPYGNSHDKLVEAVSDMLGFITHNLPAAAWQNQPWLQPARAALAEAKDGAK